MTKFFSFFAVIVLLTACGSGVDLAIDNPTNKPVTVKVDTLEVEIPAQEVVWVEMGKGDHQITLENDSVVKFNFTAPVYMVNPTLSQYLETEEYYGSQSAYNTYNMFSAAKKKDSVDYMGFRFPGNYAVVKDLINPITWDYGPRETLPQTVEIDSYEGYAVLKKLMSPQEFFKLMRESYSSEE